MSAGLSRQTRDYESSGGLNGQANKRNLWPRLVQIIGESESTPGSRDSAGRLDRAMFAGAEHRGFLWRYYNAMLVAA